MFKVYLLAAALALPARATSLLDRTAGVIGHPSPGFARAANDLDRAVRGLGGGGDPGRVAAFTHDFAAFVYTLRRQSGRPAARAAVLTRFAAFCREEAPASVPVIVDTLTSIEAYEWLLRSAHRRPRRRVDPRPSDVVIGVAQATWGAVLSTLSVPLIPIALMEPSRLIGKTPAEAHAAADWDRLFGWVAAGGTHALDGFHRTVGLIPAVTMLKGVSPNSRPVRATCDALLGA